MPFNDGILEDLKIATHLWSKHITYIKKKNTHISFLTYLFVILYVFERKKIREGTL